MTSSWLYASPTITNALSGKVSGIQIIKAPAAPAPPPKIVLRGNSSLSGSNQPLIVVDGVPMDNTTGATNNDFWNPAADMGNGLSDINAEDIESMTVLKGASAAASTALALVTGSFRSSPRAVVRTTASVSRSLLQ